MPLFAFDDTSECPECPYRLGLRPPLKEYVCKDCKYLKDIKSAQKPDCDKELAE